MPKLDEATLRAMIFEQGLTIKQVADECQIGISIVYRQCKKLDIDVSLRARSQRRFVDKIFGKLVVVKLADEQLGGKLRYVCECECGNTTIVPTSDLNSRKSCGCSHKLTGKDHHNWRGHEDISRRYWGSVEKHASDRGLQLLVTIEDAWKKFVEQNGRCALTGWQLSFAKTSKSSSTASLDRIYSNKFGQKEHYSNTNIQWVHSNLNESKGDMSPEEYVEWCMLTHLYHTAPGSKRHQELRESMEARFPQPTEEELLKNAYFFISPNGESITIQNMSDFCRVNGLTDARMCAVYLGKNEHHKGWKRNEEKCGNRVRKSKPLGNSSGRRKGYGEMSGTYWQNQKNNAFHRKQLFEITQKEAWELFERQGGKCALTGMRLCFAISKHGETTASLDRIDPTKGYVLGNVQWVHKCVNQMKWDFSQDYFLKIVSAVVQHAKGIAA